MNRTTTAFATAVLVIGTSATLAAQSETEAIAYMALQSTPVGALPPVMTQHGKQLGFHGGYGYIGYEGRQAINTFGGGVSLPFRDATVSLTAAYSKLQCPPAECESQMMVAANWTRPVMGMALGTATERAALRVAMDAGLGYGRPDLIPDLGETAWSASIGLPVSLTSSGKGMQVTPFVVPRFALGRYRVEELGGDTGASLMLGGGVGITGLKANLGINLGFQKTLIDGAPTQYGIGLTWK